MLQGMKRHLSYANVISTLCLFLVLGGTAYAAATITGKQVKNNSLTGADIRNGTLGAADLRRGLLEASAPQAGAPGKQGPAGPRGPQGAKGAPGAAGPGAVPISFSRDEGPLHIEYFDAGALTIGVSCNDREGRPQVQIWGKTDAGGEGTVQWVGIRTHSSDQSFITNGGVELGSDLAGLDSRWAPAGGWAGVGLDIQYRSGSKTATVSLHMTADDRGTGKCAAAGTAIAAG
jgi:hypothetical protein